MSASPMARQAVESKAIPIRRVVINDHSELPAHYSSTPGGTLFSTTPGVSVLFLSDSSMYPSATLVDLQPPWRFSAMISPQATNKVADERRKQCPVYKLLSGTKIVYEKSALLNLRNSPISKTPPQFDIPDSILGNPNKSWKHKPVHLKQSNSPRKSNPEINYNGTEDQFDLEL